MRRPGQPRHHPARLGDGAARLLGEQGALQIWRRDADVLAQREQLLLGEPVPDVSLCSLELGRALDDPFERLAADEVARHRYASAFVFLGSVGRLCPDAFSGRAGVLAPLAASRKPRNRSSGRGKIVVELFSEAISVTVCK